MRSHKQSLYPHFIALVCVFLTLFNVQGMAFTQYNYTFQIPEAVMKNVTNVKPNRTNVEEFEGEVLKDFLVKEPAQLGKVFKVVIDLQNEGFESKNPKLDETSALQTPQSDSLWFESYSWPIKKKANFYSIQSDKEYEIVSACHSSQQLPDQTVPSTRSYFLLYTLLSNGVIQQISNSYENLIVQKEYKFKDKSQSQNSTSYKFDWDEVTIYHRNANLYLLSEEKLYLITLKDQKVENQGRQVQESIFEVEKIVAQNIIKVVQNNGELYAFSDQACSRIKDAQTQVVLLYKFVYEAFGEQSMIFKDFDAFSNKLYFLWSSYGLIQYSEETNIFSLFSIQHPELSKKINIYKQNFYIIYEIGKEDFVVEYFFIGQTLYQNKIFYGQQEEIDEMIIFNEHMIVSRGSQVNIGMHSLSRAFPYVFHQNSELIESYGFKDDILELRQVASSILNFPAYMIVTGRTIQVVHFEQSPNFKFQQSWLKISANQSGIYNLTIKYIGTCKNPSSFLSQYCTTTQRVVLYVNDTVRQTITSWWVWIFVAVVCLLFLVIVLIVCYKYFTKKQNEFQRLLSVRNQQKRNTSVQMTTEVTHGQEKDENVEHQEK